MIKKVYNKKNRRVYSNKGAVKIFIWVCQDQNEIK